MFRGLCSRLNFALLMEGRKEDYAPIVSAVELTVCLYVLINHCFSVLCIYILLDVLVFNIAVYLYEFSSIFMSPQGDQNTKNE